MGERNKSKKISKFFNREGFYVILFVCLCVVAVVAVYISTRDTSKHVQQPQQNSQEFSKGDRSIQQQRLADKDISKKTIGVLGKSIAVMKQNQPKLNMNISPSKKVKEVKQQIIKKNHKFKQRNEEFRLILPVDGEISKKFDSEKFQESKTLQQWETHEGIDIACDIAVEVKAAADGKVIDIYNDDKLSNIEKTGFGVTVKIDHGNGIQTMYCNLAEEVKVKKGDVVKKGQVLGIVGDTAIRETSSIEGSHIHFVVLKKIDKEYITVNPQKYIKNI